MEFLVDFHPVLFHQHLRRFVAACGFDLLHFRQQLAEQLPQFLVVLDADIGLAVPRLHLKDFPVVVVVDAPVGDEGAVLHVRLREVVAELYPVGLQHLPVDDVLVIAGFVRGGVGEQP